MNDDDLFAEEMAGVKPLGRDARVRLVKERLSEDQQQDRRRAAQGEDQVINPLADEGVSPLDAWFILEFKRPGIQNGVYRKLRLVLREECSPELRAAATLQDIRKVT